MSDGQGCLEACCGAICLAFTASCQAWCDTKAFGGGGQAGCCGTCCDNLKCCGSEDAYEEAAKKRQAARDRDVAEHNAPVSTQPTPMSMADPTVAATGGPVDMNIHTASPADAAAPDSTVAESSTQ